VLTPAWIFGLLFQFQAPPDGAVSDEPVTDAVVEGDAPVTIAAEAEHSRLVPTKEIERMRIRPIGPNPNIDWKPTSGLRLRSSDGKFELRLRTRVQFRYELQHDNDDGETEQAFMIRRARIQLKGHLFERYFKYYVQIAVSPSDMGWTADGPSFTPIRNWELSFDYLRDLTVTVGQMKVNYNRQRVISSGDQHMPDRSTVTAEFNLDRDIGIKLHSDDLAGLGYLRYALGVFNGEGRDNLRVADLGLLYVGRIEVVPTGDAANVDWGDDEVDWARATRPSLAIGGSYAFHDRATRERGSLGRAPVDGGTTNFHHAQADLMLKVAGLSLTSEFQWRKGIRAFGDATGFDEDGMVIDLPRTPARNGLGYYVQAGYLIPRLPFDIVGRWGQMFGVGDGSATSLPDGDEAGVGIGWYFARHSLKLQADYARLRQDSYDRDTYTFSRESWARSTDQFRLQIQMAF
jgi:phosphate-selective porin OprO and OprP